MKYNWSMICKVFAMVTIDSRSQLIPWSRANLKYFNPFICSVLPITAHTMSLNHAYNYFKWQQSYWFSNYIDESLYELVYCALFECRVMSFQIFSKSLLILCTFVDKFIRNFLYFKMIKFVLSRTMAINLFS